MELNAGLTEVKKSEPYTISADGHYVGSDGFVVPKNFTEFFEREPMSVRRFLMKKLHRQMVDEVILDMEQDLFLHLHYLPEKSKHRLEGKTDIIQCFDPEKQHGASAKRFHNYLALCMSNRVYAILHRQKKNPVYHKTNLSIMAGSRGNVDKQTLLNATGEISEEALHNNSVMANQLYKDDENARFRKLYIREFKAYVEKSAPEILPLIEAISEATSFKDARQLMGVNPKVFDKQRETLDLLKECFVRGEDFAENKAAARHRLSDRARALREANKAKKSKVLETMPSII